MTFKQPIRYPRSVPYRAPDSPRSGDLSRQAAAWQYAKDLDAQLDAEVPATLLTQRREPEAVAGLIEDGVRMVEIPWTSAIGSTVDMLQDAFRNFVLTGDALLYGDGYIQGEDDQ